MMLSMRRPSTLMMLIGAGAGLMYFLDPQAGRRRRAVVRDQVTHSVRSTKHAIDSQQRHLRNRAQGVAAGARRLFGRAQQAAERTRAETEGRAPAL